MSAQITLSNTEICEGQTVNFDKLIQGLDNTYDSDNTETGWYTGNQKKYDKPFGFTDSPAQTTVYTLRIAKDGVILPYNTTVTVYPTPILVVPADETICSGTNANLNASVTNFTPSTSIQWIYNGTSYANGTRLSLPVGAHTLTATARNALQCPAVNKPWHVTVTFNPSRADGEPHTAATYCSKSTINLNDCIDFFVYDVNGKKDTAQLVSGTIGWYADYYKTKPVTHPEAVQLSLKDTTFYADLSDVTVSYSKTCSGALYQRKLANTRLPVSINVNSDYFQIDNYSELRNNGHDESEGYFPGMCYGDSVKAVFRLKNKYGAPSTCDIIKELTVRSNHQEVRRVNIDATADSLVFAPFNGLYDTIKIKAVSGNGMEKTFNLFLRAPNPLAIHSDPVCINTVSTFIVQTDECDTIRSITCNLSSATITDNTSSPNTWLWRMPALPRDTQVSCTVTYYSKLHSKEITESANTMLLIHKDVPNLSSVSLLHSIYETFNNTNNLCLGDALLLHFSSEPHNCDTIVNVEWLQGAGTLSPSHNDSHNRYYIIKPGAVGAHTYTARIQYKHPKESTIRQVDTTYTVQVKERPSLFINNPPDTLRYCYPDDDALNLRLPNSPAYNIINYTYVEDNSAYFLNSSSPAFSPSTTGNYWINAQYKHTCSEISSAFTSGMVRISVNDKNDRGAAFYVEPGTFCTDRPIDIARIDKEGSELKWKYNDREITLPYPLAAGTHNLTLQVKNACYRDAPLTHTILVQVDPKPEVKAMSGATVCRGEEVALTTTHLKYDDDNIPAWTRLPYGDPVTDNPITIHETTTFRVTANNAGCGGISDHVTIYRMEDAAVRLMPDTSVCENDKIRLRADYMAGDKIVWSVGSYTLPGERPEVAVTGKKTYLATVTNRCSSATATMTVYMLPLPYVKLKDDTTICYGETLDFEACIVYPPPTSGVLHWEPSHDVVTEPTMYRVTASTEKCGNDEDEIYVNVYKPLILIPKDSRLPNYNKQDFFDISFQTLQAEPELTYSLSGTLPPGLTMQDNRIFGKPVLEPYDYNTHRVRVLVTDGHRCKVSKEYILAPEWKAANVLLPLETPDTGNVVFLPGYDLEIYTRNGLFVHKGKGWDGRWNTTYVPAGTYFYKVRVLVDGKPEERMGYVVIMYY